MMFSHANTDHVMMQQSSFSPPQRPASSTVMDIFYTVSLETYVDSFQPGNLGDYFFNTLDILTSKLTHNM